MTRRCISQTLWKSLDMPVRYFGDFVLIDSKAFLMDINFVSSENCLGAFIGNPLFANAEVPCLAYLDGLLTLSWRGSNDHPDMRILSQRNEYSFAWNTSEAVDAHIGNLQ